MADRRVPNTPPWPSLYNPGLEILHIPHRRPIQPGGAYLYDANGQFHWHLFWHEVISSISTADIFRFTLYWTLILYTPMFLVCGTYAFLNLSFPPSRHPHEFSYPLSSLPPKSPTSASVFQPVPNERRARLMLTVLVLLTYMALGVAAAVVGSAIMGFVLFGFFKAAKYNMSTCVVLRAISLHTLTYFPKMDTIHIGCHTQSLWPTWVSAHSPLHGEHH
jgi:hypothetical protein